MLGMRLREGVDIHKLFKEQNWDNNELIFNFGELIKEWNLFLETGLLVKIGDRFFLSDPKGMELSNQILISMFRWWDKLN